MGLYDTIVFTCPSCGETISEQTKEGENYLATFQAAEVPVGLARGLNGMDLRCYSCGKRWTMKAMVPVPATVPVSLMKPDPVHSFDIWDADEERLQEDWDLFMDDPTQPPGRSGLWHARYELADGRTVQGIGATAEEAKETVRRNLGSLLQENEQRE